MLPVEEIIKQAETGIRWGATCICIVTSGRGPRDFEVEHVSTAAKEIRKHYPNIQLCACMGILRSLSQATKLKQSGFNKYNHNLNTSRRHYPAICSTHTYDDRIQTLDKVKQSGMNICSGIIVGMGETIEDIIETAFELRELKARSIPVNFLIPIKGTPLGETSPEISPEFCFRVLALFRFTNPSAEIRLSAGRERYLSEKDQLTALKIANSIFLDHYLTVRGQGIEKDIELIEKGGFEPSPS